MNQFEQRKHDSNQAFFAPRPTDTTEGRKILALYWSIEGFLEWLPVASLEAEPLIACLKVLLQGTREYANSEQHHEYLRQPMPDDNTGRFSNNRARRESTAESFSRRKALATPITIPTITVKL